MVAGFAGTLGAGAELSVTVDALDFLVPLAADLVFGAAMGVKRERD